MRRHGSGPRPPPRHPPAWDVNDPGGRRRIDLDGETKRRHQVVVGADPEGAVSVVGVLAHPDLEVEEFLGEGFGLGGLRKMEPAGLEEGLETRDQPGLAEADSAPFLDRPSVAMGEVDGSDPGLRGFSTQKVDDRLTDPGGVDEDAGGRAPLRGLSGRLKPPILAAMTEGESRPPRPLP
jgi:hypothetical protein